MLHQCKISFIVIINTIMRKTYSKKLCRPSSRTSLLTFVFGLVTSTTCLSLGIVLKKLITFSNCSVFNCSTNYSMSLSVISTLLYSVSPYTIFTTHLFNNLNTLSLVVSVFNDIASANIGCLR